MESTQLAQSDVNRPAACEFAEFRRGIYGCLGRRKDALMSLCDALLTDPLARSLPELSLSVLLGRQWPSVYKAFDGSLDRAALRAVLAKSAPRPTEGHRLLLGVDTSSIARPLSKTARDRTAQYVHNLPKGPAPVTYGWAFSGVTVLPDQASSFIYLLDHLRVESDRTASETAAEQLKAIVPWLEEAPWVTGDRYYGSAVFVKALRGIDCDALLRIQKNRVFHRAAPPPTHQRGHPTWHGPIFKGSDPKTHGTPDETWEGTDDRGRPVQVDRWNDLHFRQCRDQPLSVIRVVRPHASDTKRDPRMSWFIEVRRTQARALALEEVLPTYARRYGQEHGYRFLKRDLMWDRPRLRTPERFQLWTDLVALVQDQLGLARSIAEAVRRAWEDTDRAPTPRQVRRSMGRFIAEMGTPAQGCQPLGKSPGRPQGFHPAPAPRFPVVSAKRSTCRETPQARSGSGASVPTLRSPATDPDLLFRTIRRSLSQRGLARHLV